MGWLGALFGFLFITVPSTLYGLTFLLVPLLLPVGFVVSLAIGKPSYHQAAEIALSLSTPALIFGVPLLLYLYVSQLLGWVFFGWMIIYFVSRRFTGASARDAQMARARKELYALEQKFKRKNSGRAKLKGGAMGKERTVGEVMFEHLPIVSRETSDFCSKEVMVIVNDLNKWKDVLMSNNMYLAEAVLTCADVVASDFTGDTKEQVRGNAVAAQLAVLHLISRELEVRGRRG